MAHDELDRVLCDEQVISPSAGFAEAVMREVKREAGAPPDIRFPWSPVMVGLAIPLLAFVIGGASLPATATLEAWALHAAAACSSATLPGLAVAAIVSLLPVA